MDEIIVSRSQKQDMVDSYKATDELLKEAYEDIYFPEVVIPARRHGKWSSALELSVRMRQLMGMGLIGKRTIMENILFDDE